MTDRHEVPLLPLRAVMLWAVPLWISGCVDSEGVPRAGPAEGSGSLAERADTAPDRPARAVVDEAPPADAPRAATGESATPVNGSLEDVIAIPTGTTIRARLDHGISPGTHAAGDRFRATVADEVLADDGMVLVPEGARLVGTVRWPGGAVDPGSPGADGVAGEALRIEGDATNAVPELVVDRLIVAGERVPLEARGLVALEDPRPPGVPAASAPDSLSGRPRIAPPESEAGAVPAGALIVVRVDVPAALTPR